jgi:hypothetical protein
MISSSGVTFHIGRQLQSVTRKALSAKGDKNGNDDRTVGKLRSDHPLNEINLEFLKIILREWARARIG